MSENEHLRQVIRSLPEVRQGGREELTHVEGLTPSQLQVLLSRWRNLRDELRNSFETTDDRRFRDLREMVAFDHPRIHDTRVGSARAILMNEIRMIREQAHRTNHPEPNLDDAAGELRQVVEQRDVIVRATPERVTLEWTLEGFDYEWGGGTSRIGDHTIAVDIHLRGRGIGYRIVSGPTEGAVHPHVNDGRSTICTGEWGPVLSNLLKNFAFQEFFDSFDQLWHSVNVRSAYHEPYITHRRCQSCEVDVEARRTRNCHGCGNAICRDCRVNQAGRWYCPNCVPVSHSTPNEGDPSHEQTHTPVPSESVG